MKTTIVLFLMAPLAAAWAVLPGREAYRTGGMLTGFSPNSNQGVYADFYVNAAGQPWHLSGIAFGYMVWLEDSGGDPITRSGVAFTVSDLQSRTGSPHIYGPGTDIWPRTGAIVDYINRKPAKSVRTNRNGRAHIALWWGQTAIKPDTRLCVTDSNVASFVTARIDVGPKHLNSLYIGCELYGRPCLAGPEHPTSVCAMRPMGSSWLSDRAPNRTAMLGPTWAVLMEEIQTAYEESQEPNRPAHDKLDWPGEGWYSLETDGLWDPCQPGMFVFPFDPNDDRSETISLTEAWAYCREIDWPGQPRRLSMVMQGRAVGMNRHSENRYISDYLFYSREASDCGPLADKWGNPSYILPLRDGQYVEVSAPDANMPDVLGRYLTGEPRSDLNADGVVDLADYALSAAGK